MCVSRCCCPNTNAQGRCTPSKRWRKGTLWHETRWKGEELNLSLAWEKNSFLTVSTLLCLLDIFYYFLVKILCKYFVSCLSINIVNHKSSELHCTVIFFFFKCKSTFSLVFSLNSLHSLPVCCARSESSRRWTVHSIRSWSTCLRVFRHQSMCVLWWSTRPGETWWCTYTLTSSLKHAPCKCDYLT